MKVVTWYYERSNLRRMDERRDARAIVDRMIAIPGLDVHILESGAGTPILMLHGFPQSSRAYRRVIPLLADRAHVIAADMRGAGNTDVTADGYDPATIEQDLIELMDELGLERTAIVAHDWGAIVAFELCLNHPERVSRLVAIAVPAPYLLMNPAILWGLVKAMKDLWFQFVVAMPWLGPRLLAGGKQRLATYILRHFEVEPMEDDDVEAYLEVLRDPARARAASILYRRIVIPSLLKIMAGKYRGRVLRVPTLVLFGEEDRLIPRDALHVSPDDAPDLRIDFLPRAGHYAADDAPEAVALRIADFLELSAK
jgi:pimeloyl-ACP methyl ester carboxylesterase